MKKADNEFKRAMNLIWKHKQYRKVFGLHPVIIGVCLLFGILGGIAPVLEGLVEGDISGAEIYLGTVIPAFFYVLIFANFGNQTMITLASGKGFLSIPGAKYALTKGLVLSRLVCLCVTLIPTVLSLFLCALFGSFERVPMDDLLLQFGIAYVVAMIAAAVPFMGSLFAVVLACYSVGNALGNRKYSAYAKVWMEKAYAYDMPWWLVAILVIVLFVGGTFLGMKLLERTYEKRRVAIPLDQRVAQQ